MLRSAARRTVSLRQAHREHHSAAVEPTPATHPALFTDDGKRKWRPVPHGAEVERNLAGNGTWIERWRAPSKPGQSERWVYNYTLEEVRRRAGIKFAENRELATRLPELRARVLRDLDGEGKLREVALVIALIDRLYLRVGNEDSAAHEHFGATTLKKEHVQIDADTVRLKFIGKSAVPWDVSLTDAKIARGLRRQLAQAGDRVFTVGADEVNGYLASFGATAKKFRTFHATRLLREVLLAEPQAAAGERAARLNAAIARVAEQLGHTPAVCRESYIDPMVICAYMKGKLR